MYSDENVILDLDAVARIQDVMDTAMGTGAEAGTTSKEMADILDRIIDSGEYPPLRDMLSGAYVASKKCMSESDDDSISSIPGAMTYDYWAGLRTYLGDLTTGLNDRDIRMHPLAAKNFAQANSGQWPDPSTVFSLETNMGTLTRGASVWTFADGSAIDGDLYAGATLVVKCTTAIGSTPITVTINAKQTEDGDAVPIQVVIPAESQNGAEISVGSTKFVDVSSASATGGTQGETLAIMSVQERDPLS